MFNIYIYLHHAVSGFLVVVVGGLDGFAHHGVVVTGFLVVVAFFVVVTGLRIVVAFFVVVTGFLVVVLLVVLGGTHQGEVVVI